ncbi:L-2-amino-thiazoline-4-carboxylic acid hydrolase [Actinoplanes sp. NEAU-A12]|uniref:L-2-amino-thiazoline-4-carboxylic acid hydrolase n=1 Tax=Actinoplanes sandaracinus TaxID=3045177 RepID=A0ABT6WGH7_9ACTN|nr:L-2-amino-thiazoline-4-carboxylic acid hydrolase [Actinoplanes sandaracinus]MDI6098824.1 L-2-amino-thiazoline-4-carboxylic acid hydrolase [Actinoplanes sandaracinus]
MSDTTAAGPSAPPQQDQPQYDPTDWTPIIERAFFARLLELLGSRADTAWPQPVDELVRHRLAALDTRIGPLVATTMDAANSRFTALAVAAYDVVEPVCGPTETAAIVEDCLNSPLREDILAGTRGMLDHTDDPFTALVAASKQREQTYFGPSFHFERPVDDHDTYVLDVRRCLFHDVLVAAGRSELQPILCRFDLNWADAIEPARHHLRFVRPVTFASGSTCRMLFTREEHLSGLIAEPAHAHTAQQAAAAD